MPVDKRAPDIDLPPGWTADYSTEGLVTLCLRSRDFVTINFKSRCYALGLSSPDWALDRQGGIEQFSGRGWQSRLVLEAMGYLVSAVA